MGCDHGSCSHRRFSGDNLPVAFARPRSRVQSGAAAVCGTIQPLSYVLLSGVSETTASFWNSRTVVHFRSGKPAVDSRGTRTPLSISGFVRQALQPKKRLL